MTKKEDDDDKIIDNECEIDKDIVSKKMIFRVTPRMHEDLVIKLRQEKMTITKFFRMCIDTYLSEDDRFLSILDDYLVKNKIRAKRQGGRVEENRKSRKETIDKFNLSNEDIEDLYDFLETKKNYEMHEDL